MRGDLPVQPSSSAESGDSNFFYDIPRKASGISSYWRKNTSSLEAAELSNLLRALRKVAGYLGSNIGRIEYMGMSSADDSSIVVDPEMVMGHYPVPPARFDFLVGIVVHESMHKIEWSDHVWKTLEPSMEKMLPLQRVIFQKIVLAGEDIYIDYQFDETIFGLYAGIVRDKALNQYRKRITSDKVSVEELILFWWSGLFDGVPPRIEKPEYRKPLSALNTLASELFQVKEISGSVIKRCEKRASRYLDTWNKIEKEVERLHVIHKQLYWFSTHQDASLKKKPDSPPGAGKQKVLTPRLIQEIETNLAADSVDITPIIRSVVGSGDESVVPMSRWDFNIPSHPVIDRKLIGRLRAIFRNYAARKVVVNRGLLSGRIDRRRLYRAPVTGRCFKEVESIPCADWSVGLLIDASGSMRGSKWKMVENTIANIHKALKGYHNRLNAWAYFEVNGICMISKLLKGNNLLSIPPSGQTASGQAIIAAAHMMPEKIRRNILIHVTDGESNFGCDVSHGIEFCRQKKIHLITLGCGYKNKKAMEDQYHKTIQFVDYFEQLPQAMEKLFRWTFLYGDRQPFLNSK
ncbi:MAG: vWA domain-containing protein [Desulfobacterales bacterium]